MYPELPTHIQACNPHRSVETKHAKECARWKTGGLGRQVAVGQPDATAQYAVNMSSFQVSPGVSTACITRPELSRYSRACSCAVIRYPFSVESLAPLHILEIVEDAKEQTIATVPVCSPAGDRKYGHRPACDVAGANKPASRTMALRQRAQRAASSANPMPANTSCTTICPQVLAGSHNTDGPSSPVVFPELLSSALVRLALHGGS